MNIYPIVTTVVPTECRDFYKKTLDAVVVFENEWYVHLKIENWEIGFLRPNPPQRLPVFQHARPSSGLTLAVEVDDVGAQFRQFQRYGIEALGKPEESARGEQSFSVMDPAGVFLNLVEVQKDQSDIVEI